MFYPFPAASTTTIRAHYLEEKVTRMDQILHIRAHTKELSFNQATEGVVTWALLWWNMLQAEADTLKKKKMH